MLNELALGLQQIVVNTQQHLTLLFSMLAVLWGMYALTRLSKGLLLLLGIIPRRLSGLAGIIFAPLLHGNFNHLFFNSIPFFVLADFVLIFGVDVFIYVTVSVTLLSGFLIWLFARPAIHIGASSLITGYWSFLVLNSYQQADATAIILGLICIYYFAGIFLGIFPKEKGVSWEGHLFGLVAGLISNYALIHLL